MVHELAQLHVRVPATETERFLAIEPFRPSVTLVAAGDIRVDEIDERVDRQPDHNREHDRTEHDRDDFQRHGSVSFCR
jgi:hypothetical protein